MQSSRSKFRFFPNQTSYQPSKTLAKILKYVCLYDATKRLSPRRKTVCLLQI